MVQSAQYVDRETGRILSERVAQGWLFRWLYTTHTGRWMRPLLLHSRMLHRLIQWYADSGWSRWHILGFMRKVGVDLSEAAESDPHKYRSFNQFFTRSLNATCRPIEPGSHALVSPGDGKLLVLPQIAPSRRLLVKGLPMSLDDLLDDAAAAERYARGSVAILRLYLGDYHRVHFPADGVAATPRWVEGHYYSVTPFPGNDVNFYCRNVRTVTALDTRQFGLLTMVDVGGFLISSIRVSFTPGQGVHRGQEKSCFAFGGSTLVLLAEPECVRWDPDLVENSSRGLETYVKLGTRIGIAGPGSRPA